MPIDIVFANHFSHKSPCFVMGTVWEHPQQPQTTLIGNSHWTLMWSDVQRRRSTLEIKINWRHVWFRFDLNHVRNTEYNLNKPNVAYKICSRFAVRVIFCRQILMDPWLSCLPRCHAASDVTLRNSHDDVIKMKTFSALMTLCAGNSPITGAFPTQRSVTQNIDVSFDLRLNQHLSKQWRCRWFETPSRSLWRHCNG